LSSDRRTAVTGISGENLRTREFDADCARDNPEATGVRGFRREEGAAAEDGLGGEISMEGRGSESGCTEVRRGVWRAE
jgi:hypothetical protein